MLFRDVSLLFSQLEDLASRNAMTELLSTWLSQVDETEIAMAVNLSLGQLAPLYERIEFNLAEKMVVRALSEAFAQSQALVWSAFKTSGDLGEVAFSLKQKQAIPEENITLAEVYAQLKSLATDGGTGSQERKVTSLAQLLGSVDALGAKYIARIVAGRLRLGFSDMTVLDALSVMLGGNKSARKELELAYQVFPNVGEIARLTKRFGASEIAQKVQVTLGVPVVPALAQRLKTAKEMIDKMGKVMVEPKYDGTRVQIHVQTTPDFWVRSFTRNLDESTAMFPELEQIGKQLSVSSVILDTEAVGVHPKSGKLLPFQMTITRKRKHGVAQAAHDVPLCFFTYDILYLDGKPLVHLPLHKRRELLETIVQPGNVLQLDPTLVTADPAKVKAFHLQQLSLGFEGAMVKKIDSPYQPGRKNWSWVKFKEVEESQGKLSDTIDAVVMGFYVGKGKRTKFGIGAFLVGVRDESQPGMIKTIAKIGTGLSDEQWRELKRRLEQEVSLSKPTAYEVASNLEPDVWVDPVVVVEIAADEITISPMHSAGVALRFPRLVTFRDDKSLEQATSLTEVKAIAQVSA
jgi:DNA ligase-1